MIASKSKVFCFLAHHEQVQPDVEISSSAVILYRSLKHKLKLNFKLKLQLLLKLKPKLKLKPFDPMQFHILNKFY